MNSLLRLLAHVLKNVLFYSFFGIVAFTINSVIADISYTPATSGSTISSSQINQNFSTIVTEVNSLRGRASLNIAKVYTPLLPTPAATHTIQVPSGATKVVVEAVGGGGGGGGRWHNGSTGMSGGYGGAGGYAKGVYDVTAGQVLTVAVGDGGSADPTFDSVCPSPAPSTPAEDGGNTIVRNSSTSTLLVQANGGTKGLTPSVATTCWYAAPGSAGRTRGGQISFPLPVPNVSTTPSVYDESPGLGGYGAVAPSPSASPSTLPTSGFSATDGKDGVVILTFQ